MALILVRGVADLQPIIGAAFSGRDKFLANAAHNPIPTHL
jgi:hypothetical protein